MKKIFIIAIVAIFGSHFVSATTYYVSSSTGSDANSGTSSSTAWQTIAHVNGQSFNPGDSILFKRGDVWNESLAPPSSGSSGNPIAFDAYGTGAAPNLTGYYAVPTTAWVLVTGNAWKAPVPSTYTTVNFCLFGSVWGQKVAAVSSNLTTPGNFYLANGFVYVFSTGNPAIFYNEPIVPMALSNVPVININGQTWLTFQHFLVNWFDQYGVYVQGTSDHLVFANMESDSMIPQGTQPLGFYMDESAPGPGDIKIYNAEAHLNYDGFRFDGTATAITMVNDKGYANRDGALVDNTGAVTYSYCHFYASSLAVAGSTDVEWTSGSGPIAGAGNIATDTAPAVQVYKRYPAEVTLTVDDEGMTPGADTYYASAVLPVADAAGVPVGAAITVGYPLAQTLISEFQGWVNAGRDVTAHSISHTYYVNTDALDIQYTGGGTAATLNISGNTLTITVTGASDSVSYNLAQGQPQGTMLGLAQALAATGKFTYSFLTPCQGPYGTGCAAYTAVALLSQDLAAVSGQDVKTAVYHMQLNVTQLTTDEITLSREWMTTNLTGLPSTPVYVYPGGYETTTMQGITEGVPYAGARGALKEDLGVKDTYADGFNVENITSFGVNPTWMGVSGVTPALLNQKIQALVWKESVWGVPWGVFWHLNELTNSDPVGGTEITNLIQDFKASGATIQTNTGLVNWLLAGKQETGTDGNDYYTFPATSVFSSGGGLDFRPTENSPVVDAGENLGAAYELDINGVNQNGYGNGWEIGAHVYDGYSVYGLDQQGSYFRVGGSAVCGPPSYLCAITSNAAEDVLEAPSLGGIASNNALVTDTMIANAKMFRVTDSTTQTGANNNYVYNTPCGGSADNNIFSLNSTFLLVEDSGANYFIRYLNLAGNDSLPLYPNLDAAKGNLAVNCGEFSYTNNLLYYDHGSSASGTITQYNLAGYNSPSISTPSTLPTQTTLANFANVLGGSPTWHTLGGMNRADNLNSTQAATNNTSSCSANGVPTAGCNGVGSMPLSTNSGNTGAETPVVDPLPVTVSSVNLHTLLYSGATTRTMCEYQPWFSNVSPYNGHQNIGMNASNAAQVLYQLQTMKSEGCDVVVIDYYGTNSAQAYNLTVTQAMIAAIAANPSTTPKLSIMLDEGAVDGTGSGQCPPASGDQSACLESALDAQLDYVAANWLGQSYYELNGKDSHPIVPYYIIQGNWPGTNFNTVYAAVAAHATSGQSCGAGCTYPATVDFVDENNGAFTESGILGGFAWPQPNSWSSTTQFYWDGNGSYDYLGGFYAAAQTQTTSVAATITIGALYKGFDDHNASWGSNRVIAQECGQVLNLTADKIASSGYSSSKQLQYLMVDTWNDYEEGTEVETGVNNCITINQPTISGGNITWSLTKSDATYATTNTISSFSIYTGTTTPSTLFASGISPTATSYAAPTLAAGQSAWVYAVGQPLIQNQISPAWPAADFQIVEGYSTTGGQGTGCIAAEAIVNGVNPVLNNDIYYTYNTCTGVVSEYTWSGSAWTPTTIGTIAIDDRYCVHNIKYHGGVFATVSATEGSPCAFTMAGNGADYYFWQLGTTTVIPCVGCTGHETEDVSSFIGSYFTNGNSANIGSTAYASAAAGMVSTSGMAMTFVSGVAPSSAMNGNIVAINGVGYTASGCTSTGCALSASAGTQTNVRYWYPAEPGQDSGSLTIPALIKYPTLWNVPDCTGTSFPFSNEPCTKDPDTHLSSNDNPGNDSGVVFYSTTSYGLSGLARSIGVVSTTGNTVNLLYGGQFASYWSGHNIIINGANYTVTAYNSATQLTVSPAPGTLTGVNDYFTIYPGPGYDELDGVVNTGGSSPAAGYNYRFSYEYNTAINPNFYVQNAITSCSQDGKYCAMTTDWQCSLGTTNGNNTSYCAPDWPASTAISAGALLWPQSNNGGGYVYQTSGSCTTGSTEPSPFTQTVGGTTTDGGCTWTNIGVYRGDVVVEVNP
jgi:hypothetical protein